ncbi:MAG: hypothetical protein E7290_00320 [Lachnospiraceae bacterium]|nr:hypothetical protein [Lachnospiraceae bacterium]
MDTQKNKPVKGDYGYMQRQTKLEIIKTVVFFGLSFGLMLMGYLSTGTKTNLLTVVAVLGLLPASKSLVSMIMYLKVPKYKEEVWQSVEEKKGEVKVLYNLYLTSYKKNFAINAFAIRGNNVIGYTEFEKCDVEACQTHIQDLAKMNSLSNLTIKIFKEQKKFEERLVQLKELESGSKETEIAQLLCDISL